MAKRKRVCPWCRRGSVTGDNEVCSRVCQEEIKDQETIEGYEDEPWRISGQALTSDVLNGAPGTREGAQIHAEGDEALAL